MRKFIRLFALVSLVSLVGCNPSGLIEKMAPADVIQASNDSLKYLKGRRFDLLKNLLTDELKKQNLDESFRKMAEVFPDQEPKSVKTVGFFFFKNLVNNDTTYTISYEFEFEKRWVIAKMEWRRTGETLRLNIFRLYPQAVSLEEMHAFTFKGKSPVHYFVAALALVVFSISLIALVQCIRTKDLKRKWLWILFIIVGFGTFSVNWTTGAWKIGFLTFQLMSVSAYSPLYDAWTVAVSVPVGAVVFLEKLRRIKRLRHITDEPPPFS
jgi:hypothetical protein